MLSEWGNAATTDVRSRGSTPAVRCGSNAPSGPVTWIPSRVTSTGSEKVSSTCFGAVSTTEPDDVVLATRNAHETGHVVRQLEFREVWRTARFVPKHHRQRECEMREVWQWMPRAECHRERREPGMNLLAAAIGECLALAVGR